MNDLEEKQNLEPIIKNELEQMNDEPMNCSINENIENKNNNNDSKDPVNVNDENELDYEEEENNDKSVNMDKYNLTCVDEKDEDGELKSDSEDVELVSFLKKNKNISLKFFF
jgi:hypothetical protein